MNDPIANGQLELACRLGCVDDIAEAIEEGADIDCNGYSPIFIGIQNADRALLAELVKLGADVAVFEVEPENGDIVDQLMAMAPKQADQPEGSKGMAELDAKMIRAFHRMISNKGFADPVIKGRRAEYDVFADGMRDIAAEGCHAIIRDFLELAQSVTADAEEPEATLLSYLKDPANAAVLEQLRSRYQAAAEEEQPGELLKDYLKERKKIA